MNTVILYLINLGLITKISVQNGTANVKEGDIVKIGDILVNGNVEGKYTGVRYVHSLANIEAKVWYTKKEKIFFKTKVPTETGKIEKKYSIKLNNFKINFYKTLSKFQKYDTISESKKLKIFSNFYLPIEVVKMVNHEQVLADVIYTEEEAIKLGTEKIEKQFSRNPRRDCKYFKQTNKHIRK